MKSQPQIFSESIDQDAYLQWILTWKKCRHGELGDCFHYYVPPFSNQQITDSPQGPRLVRHAYFYQTKEVWDDLLNFAEEGLTIRIHMAVRGASSPEQGPQFNPLAQAISSSGQSEFIPLKPLQELSFPGKNQGQELAGKVPAPFMTQLVKNWMNTHPGYLCDQFETTQFEEKGNPESSLIRQRVNYFTFEAKDVESMKKIKNYERLYLHLGVNHNDDYQQRPSFAPVLHFAKPVPQSEVLPPNPGEDDDYYEYASPCPAIC
ncbi:MAG: hypothetical protein AAFR61_27500 [Bacteroidota bacterium]